MDRNECGNCYHWDLTAGAVQHGDCRAMPPRVFLLHDGSFETIFPVTAAIECCGWWREIKTQMMETAEPNHAEG